MYSTTNRLLLVSTNITLPNTVPNGAPVVHWQQAEATRNTYLPRDIGEVWVLGGEHGLTEATYKRFEGMAKARGIKTQSIKKFTTLSSFLQAIQTEFAANGSGPKAGRTEELTLDAAVDEVFNLQFDKGDYEANGTQHLDDLVAAVTEMFSGQRIDVLMVRGLLRQRIRAADSDSTKVPASPSPPAPTVTSSNELEERVDNDEPNGSPVVANDDEISMTQTDDSRKDTVVKTPNADSTDRPKSLRAFLGGLAKNGKLPADTTYNSLLRDCRTEGFDDIDLAKLKKGLSNAAVSAKGLQMGDESAQGEVAKPVSPGGKQPPASATGEVSGKKLSLIKAVTEHFGNKDIPEKVDWLALGRALTKRGVKFKDSSLRQTVSVVRKARETDKKASKDKPSANRTLRAERPKVSSKTRGTRGSSKRKLTFRRKKSQKVRTDKKVTVFHRLLAVTSQNGDFPDMAERSIKLIEDVAAHKAEGQRLALEAKELQPFMVLFAEVEPQAHEVIDELLTS